MKIRELKNKVQTLEARLKMKEQERRNHTYSLSETPKDVDKVGIRGSSESNKMFVSHAHETDFLRNVIAEKKAALSKNQENQRAVKSRLENVEAELNSMRSSLSWRWTKPLRLLRDSMEKGFQSFRRNGIGRSYRSKIKTIFDFFNPKEEEKPEKEKEVFFSVILPTYNRKRNLKKAIRSVLGQRYPNIELIVIDDGSTDGTGEFIRTRYAQEIEKGRIIYIFHNQSGVSPSRNVGLRHAKYEWIAYLDSDNTMEIDFFDTFARSMRRHPAKKLFYARFKNNFSKNVFGKSFNRKELEANNFIDIGVFVHHRTVYEHLGGFDEDLKRLVDWDLILRYTKVYAPLFIDKVLMHYDDREMDDRITVTQNYSAALKIISKKQKILFPTVSTIIPSYNQHAYITQAIDSVLQQQGNFVHEVILADDGSHDGTAETVANYARQQSDIVKNVSMKNNVGISLNMKRAFAACTGEYIAICEGDDYWTHHLKLHRQLMFFFHNPGCSMVFSSIHVLDQKKGSLRLLERQQGLSKKRLNGDDFLGNPYLNLIGNFSCCVFKKVIIDTLPDIMFKGRLNEIALSFYFEQFGDIGFFKPAMSVYRQHAGGAWTGISQLEKLKSGYLARMVAKSIARPRFHSTFEEIIEKQYVLPLQKEGIDAESLWTEFAKV